MAKAAHTTTAPIGVFPVGEATASGFNEAVLGHEDRHSQINGCRAWVLAFRTGYFAKASRALSSHIRPRSDLLTSSAAGVRPHRARASTVGHERVGAKVWREANDASALQRRTHAPADGQLRPIRARRP